MATFWSFLAVRTPVMGGVGACECPFFPGCVFGEKVQIGVSCRGGFLGSNSGLRLKFAGGAQIT